jgi:hypothetical protein
MDDNFVHSLHDLLMLRQARYDLLQTKVLAMGNQTPVYDLCILEIDGCINGEAYIGAPLQKLRCSYPCTTETVVVGIYIVGNMLVGSLLIGCGRYPLQGVERDIFTPKTKVGEYGWLAIDPESYIVGLRVVAGGSGKLAQTIDIKEGIIRTDAHNAIDAVLFGGSYEALKHIVFRATVYTLSLVRQICSQGIIGFIGRGCHYHHRIGYTMQFLQDDIQYGVASVEIL